ncbi:MAG: hypothetical protein ACYC9Q_13655 [Bacillota bacterium]
MQTARPAFLYHGSPKKLDRLEPRPARGVGPEGDMLTAVYATHDRAVATISVDDYLHWVSSEREA